MVATVSSVPQGRFQRKGPGVNYFSLRSRCPVGRRGRRWSVNRRVATSALVKGMRRGRPLSVTETAVRRRRGP